MLRSGTPGFSAMHRSAAILIALVSTGFSQEKTTFDDHVFPIFQQACLNCHNPDKAKGGLDLSSFGASLKGGSGGKIVEPGELSSTIMGAILQTGEKKMPPEGDKLADAQIAVIQKWIEGGLLETKDSAARKREKPKFDAALTADPSTKPEGPPPMPENLLLDPPVVTERPAAVHALATSPWAPLLAITGQHQVLLYHTDSLELVGILPFPEGKPESLAFTPDARYVIVGGGIPGKSGVTVTFDVRTGARAVSAAKEFDSILTADIRPDFNTVITGGPSRRLKIWSTESGELVHSIKKHTDWITALDISPDGVLVASGDRNGGVWVWECDSGNEYLTLRAHQAAITSATFRADSNILATASEDGSVRFWEMNGGSEVKKIDAHPGGVTAFAFGRDGASVSAGRDLKAKLWNADFSPARDLVPALPALPTAVALDVTGSRAFIADAQGSIRVYQTSDSVQVGEIQANPPSIASRLARLADEIARQQESLTALEAVADVKAAEVEAARAATAQLVKAIEPGGDPAADEAVAKQQAESAAASQAAVETAEAAATEAQAAHTAASEKLIALQNSATHWSAAADHAKRIAEEQAAKNAVESN